MPLENKGRLLYNEKYFSEKETIKHGTKPGGTQQAAGTD